MKKNLLNISLASLFALTIVWGVFLAFDWGEEYFATKQSPQYESLPFEFKLKSNPDDVIFSEAYKTEDGKDIVEYAYVANEVGSQLNEDISRRTPESYTEVIDTFKDEEGKSMETLKTTFMSKPQFYEKEGKWRQIEYATTTPEIFAMSGAIPHIKKRELAESLLPGKSVFALTSTFYPDPNTETTSVDGEVYVNTNDSGFNFGAFFQALTETNGTGASDNSANLFSYCTYTVDFGMGTDSATIDRSFILFDTSSLGASASISSATLSVYIPTKYTGANDGYDLLHLVQSTPASNTAIGTADYDQVGATHQSDTTPDITSISTGAYTGFTLNSTGLGNIAKTGVSKYGIVEGHDYSQMECGTSASGVQMSAAETAGTSQDPKLEVTYTLPATFSIGMWFPF